MSEGFRDSESMEGFAMSEGFLCDSCGLMGNFQEQMENHIKTLHGFGRLIGIEYQKTGFVLRITKESTVKENV